MTRDPLIPQSGLGRSHAAASPASVLPPARGVIVKSVPDERQGLVMRGEVEDGEAWALVRWRDGEQSWTRAGSLRTRLEDACEVADAPYGPRPSLGEGVVRAVRTLAGEEQALVELHETGETVWLPAMRLQFIKSLAKRFVLGELPRQACVDREGSSSYDNQAERLRLRVLASAITHWNENSGAFARLDIDPLPHQIQLVRHILASGEFSWLIADDVGLGKTVELGMLLSALMARDVVRRVLLITPAGLVRQWREELWSKFGLGGFLVYGQDFTIAETRHWAMYEHVIGSMDTLKQDKHMETLLGAPHWDMVVFDEGHRLTRHTSGSRVVASERFRLAAALRRRTTSMTLLTATPHQGDVSRFQALLELVRPHHAEAINNLEAHPEIITRMVVRNPKSRVTDLQGRLIFKGKQTHAVTVRLSEQEKAFDALLQSYLRSGYATAEQGKATKRGRAVGLVMNSYRKLAASSMAAIRAALVRRRQRLAAPEAPPSVSAPYTYDDRFMGEAEEQIATEAGGEFFTHERELLDELLKTAETVATHDSKCAALLEEIIPQLGAEKLVIFTEYRATQAHLQHELAVRHGADAVTLIHGGMDYKEREHAIAAFEDTAQFLISTEAGGEGVNLQRSCHVLVNFDLPWNPMRLVQRIGRLYRYGQERVVVVYNLHRPDTLDGRVVGVLYDRIAQVARNLAALGDEFSPGLEEEIFGQMAELLDIEATLEHARQSSPKQTEAELEAALERARQAVEHQQELLQFAHGFDPDAAAHELALTADHLRAFAEGMFRLLGVHVEKQTHNGRVLTIRLSRTLAEELGRNARVMRVTAVRELAARREEVEMLDMESPLFRLLVKKALHLSFQGRLAAAPGLAGSALVAAVLRWQDDRGRRMRQELAVCLVNEQGQAECNSEALGEWLLQPIDDAAAAAAHCAWDVDAARQAAGRCLEAAGGHMNRRLVAACNEHLHPHARQLVAAAWLCPEGASRRE